MRSRTISKYDEIQYSRRYAATTARKMCPRRSARPRRGHGPPPGQPQPARSRLGAISPNQRRRSRNGEIAPERGAPSGAHEAASWRHCWPPKAPRAPDARGPCCHTQPSPRQPPLRASGGRWGRLGPCAGPTAASIAGPTGTRRRRCDDTATCPSAANGASESCSWATKASS